MVIRRRLVITQVFHPNQQATSQLLSGLIARLAKPGYAWTVLAGFTEGDSRAPSFEEWQGVGIFRGGLWIDGKRSLSARAASYLSYLGWIAYRLLVHRSKGEIVTVVTNPPFAPIVVWLCSCLRRREYEVILHDVYPDGLVGLGAMPSRSITSRLWAWANVHALRGAARVFVLGRDMARLMESRYRVSRGKIVFLPNWSITEAARVFPAEGTQLWARLNFAGKFVVQYSGNMGLWHDLTTIVRAAERLANRPDIQFLLIGDGRRRAEAERLSIELALTNVIWRPFQPRESLPDSLACCHVALISQRAGLEGVAVPCKLYGILASGRAVLAQVPAQSETALVVREEECGLVIQPGDAQGLADAIKRLAGNRAEADAMGGRAFAAYRAKYTLAAAVARFEQAMNSPVAP